MQGSLDKYLEMLLGQMGGWLGVVESQKILIVVVLGLTFLAVLNPGKMMMQ